MDRQDGGTLGTVLLKLFNMVTEHHPEFNNADNDTLKNVIVDFADAESAAFRRVLGELANKLLRGCEVCTYFSLISM